MGLEYSEHWKQKQKYRKTITDKDVEYGILNTNAMVDKSGGNVLNALCRIPPSGSILKVVYRKLAKDKVKIITAYWLD